MMGVFKALVGGGETVLIHLFAWIFNTKEFYAMDSEQRNKSLATSAEYLILNQYRAVWEEQDRGGEYIFHWGHR